MYQCTVYWPSRVSDRIEPVAWLKLMTKHCWYYPLVAIVWKEGPNKIFWSSSWQMDCILVHAGKMTERQTFFSLAVVAILIPRGRDPFGQHHELRPLASPNFWACAEESFYNFQPITFVRFDNESVNRGLPVLGAARALDSWCFPKGSWPLETRLALVASSA